MGLEAALEDEPGLLCVGAVGTEHELAEALPRARPDVVVLDHQLTGTDGLHVCRRLKAAPDAPRVLMLSAYAGDALAVAAAVAGADGLVSKRAHAHEIRAAIRRVAGGEPARPASPPEARRSRARRRAPHDPPPVR